MFGQNMEAAISSETSVMIEHCAGRHMPEDSHFRRFPDCLGFAYRPLHAGFLLSLFFISEDEVRMFRRNIGRFSTNQTVLYPRI
jgi:hypothetical protein